MDFSIEPGSGGHGICELLAQKPRLRFHHLEAPSRPVGSERCLRTAILLPGRPGRAPGREQAWLKDSLKETNDGKRHRPR